MIAVRVVQMPVHKVIHMVAVRHRLMATPGAVNMTGGVAAATVLRRAAVGILRANRDHMLVHMVAMHMMQMSVMQIIHMALVLDRSMAAVRAVPMVVMIVLFASAHAMSPGEGVCTIVDGSRVRRIVRHDRRRSG